MKNGKKMDLFEKLIIFVPVVLLLIKVLSPPLEIKT